MIKQIACCWLLLFFPVYILAESLKVPSSSGGIIEKEIEQQYEQQPPSPEKEVPSVEVEIPDKELEFSKEKKIRVEKICLQGNTLLSEKEIQSVLQNYEGRELSLKEIKGLSKEIQSVYIAKGYFLVRVYIPPQDVTQHRLQIQVIEARLEEIEVQGNKYYKTRFILSFFKKYLGKTVNYNDFIKSLLLINENSDLKVSTVFKKGKELGTVDMLLQVEDKDPFHISADFNNYGSSVTTKNRSGVRTDVGNVLQDGDMLSLIGVIGYPIKDLRFIDAIYKTPLSRGGSNLELSFLFSDFQVDRLTSLNLHGKTQVAGIKFIQALKRTKRLNTDIYGGFEYKQIQNFANHQTSAFDKLRPVSLGCKVDYMDSVKGHNIADMVVFCGIPNFLGGLSSVDSECSREGAGGRYVYIDANYQRIQKLPASCFLFFNFQGQLSFYKLPISEEFYIGGINTVRGYPLATALGDSGLCANLELRIPPFFMKSKQVPYSKKQWKEVLQFVGFVDHGEVFVYGGGITNQANRIYLTSAGLGARIFGPYGINCSLDVGFPLVDRKQKTQDAIFYFRINMRFL